MWCAADVKTDKALVPEPSMSMNYDGEDLTKIINDFAAKKGINIILPQGINALNPPPGFPGVNQKVTIKFPKKIPLSQAEQLINYFLDMIGYAIAPNDSFFVVKKIEGITREPLPLFVNVPLSDLPTAQRIRAIYYLANLKVPASNQGNEPLNIFLRDQLTQGSTASQTGVYMFDPKSNGVIITDRGDVVAAVMETILRLDSSGSKETIEIVPLYNAVASTVARLVKEQILAASDANKNVIRADVKSESGSYFAQSTRVVADDRTNSLLLLGKETALARLKEFIQEYLDAAPESGRSILHAYDLQYLDAEAFAPVLKDILKSRGIGGTEQSEKERTGPQQFFEGVVVVPETYKAVEAGKTLPGTAATTAQEVQEGQPYRGGNRLIITALHKDWVRIKQLIQELDIPQMQVILEVMVVDLTILDTKKLASQLRNPSGLPLPPGFNFQAANITGIIADQPTPETPNAPPTTVAADLLRLLTGSTPPTSIAVPQSSPPFTGSTILSVADPNGSGVWLLLDWLNSYVQTKILSHPFIVTLNNVRAREIVSDIRRTRGDQSVGEGAISTIRQEDVTAAFDISMVPRVSSDERVALQISLEITDFTTLENSSTSNFTRITRKLQTNANLSTGQILVMGGLTRDDTSESDTGTPILSQIPLVGWLFRGKTVVNTKTNLAIFISPTIVNPKLTQGQKKYTQNKVQQGYDTIEMGHVFDNMRDPITRWFFRPQDDQDKQLFDEYLHEAHVVHAHDEQVIKRAKDSAISTDEPGSPASEEFKNILAVEENPLEKTPEPGPAPAPVQ